MNYTVGQTLVYPHHGAVTVTDISPMTIKGVERETLTFRVHATELTIKLPADNAEDVGVRAVIDDAGVEAVFAVLRGPVGMEPDNWSRRFKANEGKMSTGELRLIAEVVRDLWCRERTHPLSTGEKRMLLKARQLLVSELALARSSSVEDAGDLLDSVLAETVGEPELATS